MDTEIAKYDDYLGYFPGGVPASSIFKMGVDGLREIDLAFAAHDRHVNPAPEVVLIALLAYFEGFCKDHVASLINICPDLLSRLDSKGMLPTVSPADLIPFGEAVHRILGFLVAERLDLGTPKSINTLFNALLGLSPFSRNERRIYEGYLSDRNLLVHHGGNLTLKYVRQHNLGAGERERVFMDSLALTSADVRDRIDFVEQLVLKIASSTQTRIREHVEKLSIKLSAQAAKATDSLAWWP